MTSCLKSISFLFSSCWTAKQLFSFILCLLYFLCLPFWSNKASLSIHGTFSSASLNNKTLFGLQVFAPLVDPSWSWISSWSFGPFLLENPRQTVYLPARQDYSVHKHQTLTAGPVRSSGYYAVVYHPVMAARGRQVWYPDCMTSRHPIYS